ncbi:MAG TPA: TRAM domain-containing protein [Candidatus Saccharimonadales bacterium]
MKSYPEETVILKSVVGGGQTIGELADGRKLFVWGGLPGEEVVVRITKRKKSYAEGIVTQVIRSATDRVEPLDPASFLSTSPWQIYDFAAEQHYKAALIEEAFELHNIVLPQRIEVATNGVPYGYRNKVEFSFWWDTDTNTLDLAFFKRGGNGKVPVTGTSLAMPAINDAAQRLLAMLRIKQVEARALKTALIRCDQKENVLLQLYVKDEGTAQAFTTEELVSLGLNGAEVIYSDHRSPASVITKRYAQVGATWLEDTIHGIDFRYATEGFFQVNIPMYEQSLADMQQYIPETAPVIDMYSGVGSIGLTIGGPQLKLIESNDHAIAEMQRNIANLHSSAVAIHAPAEKVTDHITSESLIILDPPRAGLHAAVIERLLSVRPPRIVYLSCNPVTQARDVALLAEAYGIRAHKGYNFFPRTPHIEHLVVLDLK